MKDSTFAAIIVACFIACAHVSVDKRSSVSADASVKAVSVAAEASIRELDQYDCFIISDYAHCVKDRKVISNP